MQDLPNGGGGAQIQALAPGRWRPSGRHWGAAVPETPAPNFYETLATGPSVDIMAEDVYPVI